LFSRLCFGEFWLVLELRDGHGKGFGGVILLFCFVGLVWKRPCVDLPLFSFYLSVMDSLALTFYTAGEQ
jgi:hypothetical protein